MASSLCWFVLFCFCRMPSDDRYRIWCSAVEAHSVSPYTGFICIRHFLEDDLIITKQRTVLKKDAIPKIFNTNSSDNAVANALVARVAPINTNDTTNNSLNIFRDYTRDVLNRENTKKHEVSEIIEPCHIQPQQCANHKNIQSHIDHAHHAGDVAQGADIQCPSNKCCNRCDELKGLNDILKAEYDSLREEFIDFEAKRCIEIANYEREINKLKMEADIRKQHIKYLSAKVYRKEKSEESLKLLLKELKEKSILSTKAYETLEVI